MKMDWIRTGLIAGIAIISFLLVIRWNEFQERNAELIEAEQRLAQPSPSSVESAPLLDVSSELQADSNNDFDNDLQLVAEAPTSTSNQQSLEVAPAASQKQYIQVRTNTLEVLIDPKGGDIAKVALPAYFNKINTPDDPFVLLDNTGNHTYLAISGLSADAPIEKMVEKKRPLFSASANEYVMSESDDELLVTLSYKQSENLTIQKVFQFERDSHLINIRYKFINSSDKAFLGNLFGSIIRDNYNPTKAAGLGMAPFLGAATTTVDKNYEKLSFSDIQEDNTQFTNTNGWIAMVQHYFLTAYIPPRDEQVTYQLMHKKNLYYLAFKTPAIRIEPNTTTEKTLQFYAGPKDINKLEEIIPHLYLTVDYGWLWWIAKPLFHGLDAIHSVVNNWGVAIIILTMLIKLLFFYPSAASYRSMAKMRKVQPKMKELKERFGSDRQRFSQEMMKLYKTEKVNPLGGCLPILIQMPVFLALYWVLMESVELRQAPFALWIQDLSVKDPYFVLPIIMGATMWIQQKLNPTPPDPMQAKVMQMMPIFFTFLFLFFPSGLVLYWVVNNTLSITQQYIITKQIERAP